MIAEIQKKWQVIDGYRELRNGEFLELNTILTDRTNGRQVEFRGWRALDQVLVRHDGLETLEKFYWFIVKR